MPVKHDTVKVLKHEFATINLIKRCEDILKKTLKYCWALGLASMMLPLLQCATAPSSNRPTGTSPSVTSVPMQTEPSSEQQYAGEILAYLMQVVLGKAGDPRMREAWYTKGADTPLDLELVSKLMTDPSKDMKQILVLDNNIQGLSKVLYHYNVRLNLFKGEFRQESLFPSVELLCMRMLLLQKIHRGEKVNMQELMQEKAFLTNPDIEADDIEPGETGLNQSELKVLKDIIDAEPFFMDYFENPFIVDTLYRVGALSMDPFVRKKIDAAVYQACTPMPTPSQTESRTVKIAILPSLVNAFEYRNVDWQKYPCGFKPNEAYEEASRKVQDKILNVTRQLVKVHLMSEDQEGDTATAEEQEARAEQLVSKKVEIINLDQRPFAIYPDNAARMIDGICPEADFTIIILGANVYLSLHMTESDIYPYMDRIYLDIMDIRHDQVDFELSQVGMFIFSKIKNFQAS